MLSAAVSSMDVVDELESESEARSSTTANTKSMKTLPRQSSLQLEVSK